VWVDARCSDGPIDLAAVGFERTVDLAKRGKSYVLTFDTKLATEGCQTTSVWTAEPEADLYSYRMSPESWVSWPMSARTGVVGPAGGACGAEEREPVLGEIHRAGDALELVMQRSPWCRGFDVHFVFRAIPRPSLEPAELVARYVAHFDRGDALSLAQLFESQGVLIESFTATQDGQPARHEGRTAIAAYFERVFASSSWHAARLLALSGGDDPSVITADLEYMDSELAEPLRLRASFVLAGGEIFESEAQLVTDPKPAHAVALGAEPMP